jgi:hypothetical protein
MCDERRGVMVGRMMGGYGAKMERWVVGPLLLLVTVAGGCASRRLIPNTSVSDTEENRVVLEVVERYRMGMERRDVPLLMTLASPQYHADGGTPRPDDDFGFDGLKRVLKERLSQLESLRYDLEYRDLRIENGRAQVDVYVDASWVWAGDGGNRVGRMSEHQRLELIFDGKRWLFTRGM